MRSKYEFCQVRKLSGPEEAPYGMRILWVYRGKKSFRFSEENRKETEKDKSKAGGSGQINLTSFINLWQIGTFQDQ